MLYCKIGKRDINKGKTRGNKGPNPLAKGVKHSCKYLLHTY